MSGSSKRILTTHTGSLPRPREVVDVELAMQHGKSVDEKKLSDDKRAASEFMVRKQIDVGIDIVNDGEVDSSRFRERLSGFGGEIGAEEIAGDKVDFGPFPDFMQNFIEQLGGIVKFPICDGPVKHLGFEGLEKEIDDFKNALNGANVEGAFMTARSPGWIAWSTINQHYSSEEEYLEAISVAMRDEYAMIHKAGFTLQLDCPDLARPSFEPGLSLKEHLKRLETRVELLNQALVNVPAEDMRLHLCWGGLEMTRHDDIPLGDIIDVIFKAKPAGLLLMGANGRHAHEWSVFEDVKLPEGKYIVAGVIDNVSNVVEHPDVVAERLVRYAGVIGRENLLAAPDCGFFSPNSAGEWRVPPTVVWAKLQSMAEGAALASKELW